MHSDIVVIGSGVSGLTAAAILAGNGRHVLVIDKEPRFGGALKRFTRQGISFDVGFHYTGGLGKDEILNRIWHYCDVLPRIEVIAFPAHGADRLYLQKHPRPVDAFFNYALYREELIRHFPRERQGIETYFTTIQKICATIPFFNRQLPVKDFLRGYKPPRISFKSFLSSITADTALQSALAAPAVFYGIPADNVSINVHAMVAHGYYQGAYGVRGGGQSIVDAYVSSCREKGVSFLAGEQVKTILTDQSRVTGVLTEKGTTVSCRDLIFTGHPTQLISMLPSSVFRPAYTKRLLGLKNTISMNILFGTVPQATTSLDWQNHILLPDGADIITFDINSTKGRALMLTSTDRGCNCLPQKDKSVILLQPACWEEVKQFEYSTPQTRPSAYQQHKENICNNMIQLATQQWGDLFTKITPITTGTPLTMRDALHAPHGCAYGAMHSLDQFTPEIRTRLPGLLLSGQSTLMTGVAGAAISGMISAGEILGLESLWEALR